VCARARACELLAWLNFSRTIWPGYSLTKHLKFSLSKLHSNYAIKFREARHKVKNWWRDGYIVVTMKKYEPKYNLPHDIHCRPWTPNSMQSYSVASKMGGGDHGCALFCYTHSSQNLSKQCIIICGSNCTGNYTDNRVWIILCMYSLVFWMPLRTQGEPPASPVLKPAHTHLFPAVLYY
jgi:hypothetical protein